MTQWEKMLAGQIYNDFDETLFQRRVDTKKLFRAYNETYDSQIEKRKEILSALFKSVGESVWIEPDFRCEYGENITIGNNVYINFGCIILDCANVSIGDNTLLGPNIGIYTVNHLFDPEERAKGGCIAKPVAIGKNVWIGGDTKILQGVTIGDGSVIGAGSIVTKDIPSGAIAAGNPCKIIRKITNKDKTNYLQSL